MADNLSNILADYYRVHLGVHWTGRIWTFSRFARVRSSLIGTRSSTLVFFGSNRFWTNDFVPHFLSAQCLSSAYFGLTGAGTMEAEGPFAPAM